MLSLSSELKQEFRSRVGKGASVPSFFLGKISQQRVSECDRSAWATNDAGFPWGDVRCVLKVPFMVCYHFLVS
jgi:hypothetical protein